MHNFANAADFLLHFGWIALPVVVLLYASLRFREFGRPDRERQGLHSVLVAVLGLIVGVFAVIVCIPLGKLILPVSPVLAGLGFVFLARRARRIFSGVLLAFWCTFLGFVYTLTVWLLHWDETGQSGVGVLLFLLGGSISAVVITVFAHVIMSGDWSVRPGEE